MSTDNEPGGFGPIHTFTSITEGKDSMTLYFVTKDGRAECFEFGIAGGPFEYALVTTACAGRWSQPALEVQFYFRRKGEEGVPLFEGVKVTHSLRVKLPKEDAFRLTHQLSAFMHGTAWAIETTAQETPELSSIDYGDDYFVLRYNYDSLKIGLTDAHRCTLTETRRDHFELELGFTEMTFFFTDEEGEELKLKVRVPTEKINEIAAELNIYLAAFQKQHTPKFEAAYLSSYFLQAA